MSDAEKLSAARRCAVVAAAGCGKTHLIATAVARHGGGRELILTHTHAGVDALKRRLRKLEAATSGFVVNTIAGWCLRLASSFPASSGLASTKPTTNAEWGQVYGAAARLLPREPIRKILQASYSGVYVDEYQDCTRPQHDVVLGLAETLPCRLLGDPLQGIFDGVGKEPVVDWTADVVPTFDTLDVEQKPWRWLKAGRPDLGEWLLRLREGLLSGDPADLRRRPSAVEWVALGERSVQHKKLLGACFRACVEGESSVVIRAWGPQGHSLARRLSGRFTCVEPISLTELFAFARSLDGKTGSNRAVAVLAFASNCLTKVKAETATFRKAFAAGRTTGSKKHPRALEALSAVANTSEPIAVQGALDSLRSLSGAKLIRRELYYEGCRMLRAVEHGETESFEDAAWEVRSRTRRVGRPVVKRAFGTTLLVKGQEFDHAVVLDADQMNAQHLYVAMTRGAKSLTIVSKTQTITPVARKSR